MAQRDGWPLVATICVALAWGAPTQSAERAPPADSAEAIRIALGTKDFATALAALKGGAERGDRDAQYLLGLALVSGTGIVEDRVAGRRWLEQAASRDHPAACYALAGLLAHDASDYAQMDVAGANQWLTKAASLGYSLAIEMNKRKQLPLAPAYPDASAGKAVRFAFARWAIEAGREDLLPGAGVATLINEVDEFGRGLLGWAAFAGNAKAAQWLVQQGSEVDAKDAFGTTPLMLAVTHENTAVTSALLAAGAKVDPVDKVQRTALTHATWADRPQQVQLLVKAKADINHTDARGWTPLDVAVQRNRSAAATQLRALGAVTKFGTGTRVAVATGIDPTRTGSLYQGWSPLLVAVSRNDETLVQQLLQSGGDARGLTPQKDTALHVAVEARAAPLIPLLLAAGADPAIENKGGESALDLAIRRGDQSMVNALLNAQRKRDPSAVFKSALAATRTQQTAVLRSLLTLDKLADVAGQGTAQPLLVAARSGNIEVARAWLEHGIDVNATDREGRSAIWYAARDGRTPMVAELLAAKAKVNAADRSGITALAAAAAGGHAPVVKALLAAGASIDLRSKEGTSALGAAAGAGHAEVVQVLLAQKAAVDATDQFGNTPLLLAARAGHEGICRMLLTAGASTRIRNSDRLSAVQMAEMRGDLALAQTLRDH